MNVIIAKNNINDDIILDDLYGFSLTISGTIDLLEYFDAVKLARSDKLVEKIADLSITINNGYMDLTPGQAIKYVSLHHHINPTAPDGREIIRADSRPEDTETFFTTTGDSVSNIGDGGSLFWDFSNSDNMYTVVSGSNGPSIPSGMKAKQLDLMFVDSVYIKEGTIYFFDAPWGSHAHMYVVAPEGSYYPNPSGYIPASALGLSGSTMFAYADKDVYYTHYVNKQFMYQSCPMGDELNAEGCQINAMPAGWLIRAIIFTNEDETSFKGYASLELYRERTILLPGCSV